MLRFEQMVASGLTAKGHRVSTISPKPFFSRPTRSYRYSGWRKYLGYIDKFILFPFTLRRKVKSLCPDVIHIIDHANSVYARRLSRCQVLVTCHDLLSIQLALGQLKGPRPGILGRVFQQWILRNLRRAPLVVCVSTKTQHDLIQLTGRSRDRTPVILNGLNFPFQRQSAEQAYVSLEGLEKRSNLAATIRGGFLLNIGGTQWYKNRRGLLDIYAALRPRLPNAPALILVGKELTSELKSHLTSLGLQTSVFELGPVSNNELEALYSLADGLIFPSLAEGFGWPIAEAHACGCPVFTSNRAPLTEVGGTNAVYFDPTDPEGAAQTIVDAWPQREKLHAGGLQHASQWSADRMISQYENVYRQ